jgi:hypothetical protein
MRLLASLLLLAALSGQALAAEETSEAAATFSFAAAGDFGANDDATATLEGIAGSGVDFALALGDLSYGEVPTEEDWCDYVKAIVGEDFPFQLVAGNHEDDYGDDGHISAFAACLPDRMNSVGEYGAEYYFDYGELARFILISPDLTIDGVHYYLTLRRRVRRG